MKTLPRRGALLLGLSSIIALLGFLAYAAHTASLSTYREAARLRWRTAANQLALGGLATARARLADDPAWTGETWIPDGALGRVEIRVLPTDPADSVFGLVEIRAAVPARGGTPLETVVLRAALGAPSAPGAVPSLESSWWVTRAAGKGGQP